MVLILILLCPIIDIISLAKYIQVLNNTIKSNSNYIHGILFLIMSVIVTGFIRPVETLNYIKTTKSSEKLQTADEKLALVIQATIASRNYLLGIFSLFLFLIIIRLLDYVEFSAKLHEFSNLMANYDIVDITLNQDKEPEDQLEIYEDISHEEETIRWPSITKFSKIDKSKLKNFFSKRSSRKLNIKKNDSNLIKI